MVVSQRSSFAIARDQRPPRSSERVAEKNAERRPEPHDRSCGVAQVRGRAAYDKLVQSAGLLFQDNGYSSVSIRDIVSAVGAPKGTFFNYFASKEALASSILERQFQDLCSSLPSPDGRGVQRKLWRYFFTLARQPVRGKLHPTRLIGTLMAESLVLPPLLNKQLVEGLRNWSNQLVILLTHLQLQCGLTTTIETDLLAECLVNSLLGAMTRAKCDSSTLPLRAFTEISLRQLRVDKDG